MKLFCDLFSRRRSNKKKEAIKLISSPMNMISNNAVQPINQSVSSCYDQTGSLFAKYNKCTCHYFSFNESCLAKIRHSSLISTHSNSDIPSLPSVLVNNTSPFECVSDPKYILTITDFCFWYDVRSTLLDMIDRIVAIEDETRRFPTQQTSSTIIKFCLPQSNAIHRRNRRPKTSIASQTSSDDGQRRNAKVQTTTLTLFPLKTEHISSSRLVFN